MRSLIRHSVQRVLGLKRNVWTKVLPFLTIFFAYVPAIVFVGVAVLVAVGVLVGLGPLHDWAWSRNPPK